MSPNDTNGEESTDPDWGGIGRDLLGLELRVRSQQAHTELYDLAKQIQNGEEPNASDLRAAREHLDMALLLVEKHLGPTGGGSIVTEFDDGFDDRLCTCTGETD
jgi:hypothetical protein